jgi:L-amino acid N-acyltransferase YncA
VVPPRAATPRHVDPQRDAAACAAIYAPYVNARATSFEEIAPDARRLRSRIVTITRTHPWLVLEDGGRVIGYAYASMHRSRPAYRWAAEVGIYIESGYQRRGGGRRLYEALLDLLRRQNFRIALAGITLPNDASVAFHGALGFGAVGINRAIGWKQGAWHDVSWWQLDLVGDDRPPAELRAPQQLDG